MRNPACLLAAISLTGCLELEEPATSPPPMPALAPAPCPLLEQRFAIESITLPRNASEAERMGFDLDGDETGRIDNAGGLLIAWLVPRDHDAPPPIEARVNAALAAGELHWYLRVQRCERGRDHTRAALVDRLDEAIGARGLLPAVGTGRDAVDVSTGVGAFPLSALFGGDTGVWSLGLGLAVDASPDVEGALSGRLGAGIPIEALGDLEQVDPTAQAIALTDIDLTATYEGKPVYWPRHDGDWDHLSLGFGFRAVPLASPGD